MNYPLDTYPLGTAINTTTKAPLAFYLHARKIWIHDDTAETLTLLNEAPACDTRSEAHQILKKRFPPSTHDLHLFP